MRLARSAPHRPHSKDTARSEGTDAVLIRQRRRTTDTVGGEGETAERDSLCDGRLPFRDRRQPPLSGHRVVRHGAAATKLLERLGSIVRAGIVQDP